MVRDMEVIGGQLICSQKDPADAIPMPLYQQKERSQCCYQRDLNNTYIFNNAEGQQHDEEVQCKVRVHGVESSGIWYS